MQKIKNKLNRPNTEYEKHLKLKEDKEYATEMTPKEKAKVLAQRCWEVIPFPNVKEVAIKSALVAATACYWEATSRNDETALMRGEYWIKVKEELKKL